ncbi:MAG: hypothetical protein JWM35_2025 [Verrucomicrobia bacterium]|nr:hypothetical protein [Verrucomicrobiota bacterium]
MNAFEVRFFKRVHDVLRMLRLGGGEVTNGQKRRFAQLGFVHFPLSPKKPVILSECEGSL